MADAASPKKRGRPAKNKDAPAAAAVPAAEPKEVLNSQKKRISRLFTIWYRILAFI